MSTRRIVNTLTAAFADSAATPTGSQSPSSAPEDHDGPSMFPDSSVPYLMTLHALLPDLLLPALNLLDRGLVERICRDETGDRDGAEAELAFYAVYADEDDDDIGEQSEGRQEGKDDEFDIVRLTAWNCTCAEFAMDAFGDKSMGLKAQMGGMGKVHAVGEITGIEAFMEGLDVEVEEYGEDQGYVDQGDVGSENEQGVVEETVRVMVDTAVAESDQHKGRENRKRTSSRHSISRLRQATTPMSQQAPSTRQALHDSTMEDIVNDLVDSAAMKVDMDALGFTMADAFIQELADVPDTDTDEEADSEGQVHRDDNQWQADGHGFGGISHDGLLLKDNNLVPCCKHLLACFLVEKCGGLLRPYIEERSVDKHELAGMAAI